MSVSSANCMHFSPELCVSPHYFSRTKHTGISNTVWVLCLSLLPFGRWELKLDLLCNEHSSVQCDSARESTTLQIGHKLNCIYKFIFLQLLITLPHKILAYFACQSKLGTSRSPLLLEVMYIPGKTSLTTWNYKLRYIFIIIWKYSVYSNHEKILFNTEPWKFIWGENYCFQIHTNISSCHFHLPLSWWSSPHRTSPKLSLRCCVAPPQKPNAKLTTREGWPKH